MQSRAVKSTRAEQAGLIIHGAVRYDLLVWLFTLGGEKRFREKILRLAELEPGETVLDIGCGTGTLAVLAKRQVGREGVVYGVDASPEMIARAKEKARRAKVAIEFSEAPVQALPLPNASVDVVLSTLMLHHLPKKARPQIARETRRVLKPGGRFLVVDFAKPTHDKRTLMDRFHRHGFIKLDDLIAELEVAGFAIVKSAEVEERNLHYVLASADSNTIQLEAQTNKIAGDDREHCQYDREPEGSGSSRARGHGLLLFSLGALALVLLAMHAGFAISLCRMVSDLHLSPFVYGGLALIALFALLLHLSGGRLITGLVGARNEQLDAE